MDRQAAREMLRPDYGGTTWSAEVLMHLEAALDLLDECESELQRIHYGTADIDGLTKGHLKQRLAAVNWKTVELLSKLREAK